MSENIKENKETIDYLRNFLITQLKENSWEGVSTRFSNEYVNFFCKGYDNGWFLKLKFGQYNSSDEVEVSNFLNKWHFWFLRTLYVRKALKNSSRIAKEAELAKLSKKFFDNNKDILRDNKLDKLLK